MINPFQRIHDAFNNEKTRKTLVKARLPIALLFIVFIIFNIKKEYFYLGMLITFFGEFIQVWCFSSLDKQKTIAIRGLYSITRNPMYLGRYFLILGGIVLTGNIWLIIIYTVFYYFYMVNRVKREEKTLTEIFGDDYLKYLDQVNRFFPSFKITNAKTLFFFRWKLFFQNNAHINILSVIITYAVIYNIIFNILG
ncbi:MAG: isoprenylcysteine carboxylmethyltransferase family protein [Desulfobacteraceae bacterium]|nr:isoprenylcysteine carboxylmethyltransferase family protein [Desulfobacteraceae bacterium]